MRPLNSSIIVNYNPNQNNMRPLNSNIIVKRLQEESAEQEIGGIILPETAKIVKPEAEVIAIGREVVEILVGDTVMLPSHGGTPIRYDGVDLILIKEAAISAVL